MSCHNARESSEDIKTKHLVIKCCMHWLFFNETLIEKIEA